MDARCFEKELVMDQKKSSRQAVIEWALAIALVLGGVAIWKLGSTSKAMANNFTTANETPTDDPACG